MKGRTEKKLPLKILVPCSRLSVVYNGCLLYNLTLDLLLVCDGAYSFIVLSSIFKGKNMYVINYIIRGNKITTSLVATI